VQLADIEIGPLPTWQTTELLHGICFRIQSVCQGLVLRMIAAKPAFVLQFLDLLVGVVGTSGSEVGKLEYIGGCLLTDLYLVSHLLQCRQPRVGPRWRSLALDQRSAKGLVLGSHSL
jgi:hypothetical protein